MALYQKDNLIFHSGYNLLPEIMFIIYWHCH